MNILLNSVVPWFLCFALGGPAPAVGPASTPSGCCWCCPIECCDDACGPGGCCDEPCGIACGASGSACCEADAAPAPAPAESSCCGTAPVAKAPAAGSCCGH